MVNIEKSDFVFEVKDIFGRLIRATKSYWNKIFLSNIKNKKKRRKNMAKVKIYFDPIGNTMNIWWGNPKDAFSSEEVDSKYRNDVIIKDKKGRPISLEIIGVLPKELNISERLKKLIKNRKTPFILSSK
jgi:hypothetical protein